MSKNLSQIQTQIDGSMAIGSMGSICSVHVELSLGFGIFEIDCRTNNPKITSANTEFV